MYTVQSGDTIFDATFNVTGSLAGLDPMLELNTKEDVPMLDYKTMKDRDNNPESNAMETYTPDLQIDQQLETDGLVVYNLEAIRGLPFNSSLTDEAEVIAEVDEMVELLTTAIPFSQIPLGYNMRGKTLVFTRQEITPNIDVIRSSYIRYNTDTGVQSIMDAFLSGENLIIQSQMPRVVFYSMGAWRASRMTYQDDFDMIIVSNQLKPHVGDEWGFDYVYVLE